MKDRVVVVTGASGALGSAVTAMARARGARIVAVDHAAAAGSDADVLALGGVDLTDAAQAMEAMNEAAAHFGRIDVLLNIAGAFAFESIADGDSRTWQRLYAINTLSVLHASRAAIPHLVTSRAGRIVNVGALAALKASSGMGPYTASKAAVHRLTEALADELKGRITVNAVLPSTIDTPANRAAMPDADFESWVTRDELAETLLFLASPAASAITGALIPVAGRV